MVNKLLAELTDSLSKCKLSGRLTFVDLNIAQSLPPEYDEIERYSYKNYDIKFVTVDKIHPSIFLIGIQDKLEVVIEDIRRYLDNPTITIKAQSRYLADQITYLNRHIDKIPSLSIEILNPKDTLIIGPIKYEKLERDTITAFTGHILTQALKPARQTLLREQALLFGHLNALKTDKLANLSSKRMPRPIISDNAIVELHKILNKVVFEDMIIQNFRECFNFESAPLVKPIYCTDQITHMVYALKVMFNNMPDQFAFSNFGIKDYRKKKSTITRQIKAVPKMNRALKQAIDKLAIT